MSSRRVTAVTIDTLGYVMTIHNDSEVWSFRSAADVVLDLELGSHDYFVEWPEGRTDIRDASDQGGRYLRTDRHDGDHNDLLDLPHWTVIGIQHKRAVGT